MGALREAAIDIERTDLCEADYEAVIGRELALPLHLLCHPPEVNWPNYGYEPGRIVLSDVTDYRSAADTVCTQDVLHAGLFTNCQDEDTVPLAPLADDITAVLREAAPQVRAVLAGNHRFETGFHKGLRRETDECRVDSVRNMTEFAKRACGTIRDLGGRPALGIVSPQIIFHAYWADQHLEGGDPLLPVLIDNDALVISFSGPAHWWLWKHEFYPQHGKQRTYQWYAQNEDLDEWPFQRIINWVSAVECWGGVEYLDGLKAGNDEKLAFGGFRGGVIGQLPDGSR